MTAKDSEDTRTAGDPPGTASAQNLYEWTNGRGALISPDGLYRYRLWRLWDDEKPVMVWVMLNPSTADADVDDPTIRKCVGFAKQNHHGGIIVVNLFAWRATDKRELPKVADPVGPENDEHIRWAVCAPVLATVVAGWGATGWNKSVENRARQVSTLVRAHRPLQCFKRSETTRDPWHPLYLPYASQLQSMAEVSR